VLIPERIAQFQLKQQSDHKTGLSTSTLVNNDGTITFVKQKVINFLHKLTIRQRMVGVGVIAIVLIIVVIQLIQPPRSVAAFCKVYKQENAKLTKAYGAAAYTQGFSNPSLYAKVYTKLDNVAPRDIEPDVRAMKKAFQSINQNPANEFGAGFGALAPSVSVEHWTDSNCR
jgi:hypothetical protein